jgi:hypothetical protein
MLGFPWYLSARRERLMTLMSNIDAMSDQMVSDFLRTDPDVFRQAKRVAAFDLALLFWTIVFAMVYTLLGSPRCGLVTLWTVLPILASLAALKRGKSPAFCGNLLCAGGYLTLTALGSITGGWTAIPPMLWYTVLPVVAVLTCGVRWGFIWTLIALASVGVFALVEGLGITLPQELSSLSLHVFGIAAVAGLLLCQFVLAWVRVGVEQRALDALDEARKSLARMRAEAESLKAGFGFSMEDWARLKREKAALEHFVECRFGNLGLDPLANDMDRDELDMEDDELHYAEFEDAPAAES